MKKENLNSFWSVSLQEGLVTLYHCGEPVQVMELSVAQALSDTVMGWTIEQEMKDLQVNNYQKAYNYVDEDGEAVDDEILMSAID